MSWLFHTFFFDPLYNGLVFLSAIIPSHDVGWAIVILTFLVRLILFPLQRQMSQTQVKMKLLEPELKKIKVQYAKDKAGQGRLTMELYRRHKINPFAGLLLLFIQLPILFALFYVFRGGFNFQADQLYSFVDLPRSIQPIFLGLVDLTTKSYVLAILAGLTQFFQIRLSLPPTPPASPTAAGPSLKADLAKSMQLQMKYVLPVMIAVFALGFPSAVALYWVASNLFMIAYELYFRRQAKNLRLDLVPTG